MKGERPALGREGKKKKIRNKKSDGILPATANNNKTYQLHNDVAISDNNNLPLPKSSGDFVCNKEKEIYVIPNKSFKPYVVEQKPGSFTVRVMEGELSVTAGELSQLLHAKDR